MSNENSVSNEVGWAGIVILLFAGIVSGAGLWGLYLGARYLLMLCGVQFNSM